MYTHSASSCVQYKKIIILSLLTLSCPSFFFLSLVLFVVVKLRPVQAFKRIIRRHHKHSKACGPAIYYTDETSRPNTVV